MITIDPLVRKWSTHFAGASRLFPLIVQSVIVAEGGMTRIVKAVQCSQPSVTTVDEAVQDTCRSVVHRLADRGLSTESHEIISYLGSYWAPIGVANDPNDLNVNWVKNATAEYEKLVAELAAGETGETPQGETT